jgi:hypothetical protein
MSEMHSSADSHDPEPFVDIQNDVVEILPDGSKKERYSIVVSDKTSIHYLHGPTHIKQLVAERIYQLINRGSTANDIARSVECIAHSAEESADDLIEIFNQVCAADDTAPPAEDDTNPPAKGDTTSSTEDTLRDEYEAATDY